MAEDIVRRCPHCAEPAAVNVRDWPSSQSYMGIPLGPDGGIAASDFVCQSCGATFRPRTRLPQWGTVFIGAFFGALLLMIGVAMVVEGRWVNLNELMGGLVMTTIGGGLSAWALREFAGPWRHAVVPDVAVPTIQYRNTEPLRMCTCGEMAVCTKVVENTQNGLPTGTEMDYQCTSCSKTFVIENVLGMVLSGGVGLGFLLGGLAVLAAGVDDWQGAACVGFVVLLGLLSTAAAAMRLYDRYHHPVVYQGPSVGGADGR